MKAEALLFGNYEQADVDRLAELLTRILPEQPQTAIPRMRVAQMDAGDEYVYKVDVDHADSVLNFYFQGADNSCLLYTSPSPRDA